MRMRLLRPSRTVEICLFAIRYSSWRFPIESSRAPSCMLTRNLSSVSIVVAFCMQTSLPKRITFTLQNSWAECGFEVRGGAVYHTCENRPKSREKAPVRGAV